MLTTNLRAVGGSVMFAIPKAILETLGLCVDAPVGLSVTNGKLVVDPHPKQRYTLSELMSQCDLSAPHSEETDEWLQDEPVGKEIL